MAGLTFNQRRSGPPPQPLVTSPTLKDEPQVAVTPVVTTAAESVNDDLPSTSFKSPAAASQRSTSTSSETHNPEDNAQAGGSLDAEDSHEQALNLSPARLSIIDEESAESSPQPTTPSRSNESAAQPGSVPSTQAFPGERSRSPLSSRASIHGEAVEVSSEPESEPRGRSVQFRTRIITVSASPSETASLDRSVTSLPRTQPLGRGRRGSGPLSPPAFDGTSIVDFDLGQRSSCTGTPILTPLLTKLRRSNNSSTDSGHTSSSMSPKWEELRSNGSIGSLRGIVSSFRKASPSTSQKGNALENQLQLEDELPDTREGLEARLNYHLSELDLLRKLVKERNREIEQTSSRLHTHQRLREDVERCSLEKLEELRDNIRQQRNGFARFVDYHRGEIRRISQRREDLDISQGIRPATREMYKAFEKEAEWVKLFSE